MRFAGLLIQAVQAHGDGGKYITATEWDKATAAARAAYEEAAQRAGWKPVKTVAEILKAKPFPEGKDKPRQDMVNEVMDLTDRGEIVATMEEAADKAGWNKQ